MGFFILVGEIKVRIEDVIALFFKKILFLENVLTKQMNYRHV